MWCDSNIKKTFLVVVPEVRTVDVYIPVGAERVNRDQ